MSLIQFKRGLKNNLPLLAAGEPAFTLDTGELYIGDGQKNIGFTQLNPNLIVNGNFQVALTPIDRATETPIVHGVNYYRMFGNYVLKNMGGNVFVSRPPTKSRLHIRLEGASIEMDYFELACAYNLSGVNYGTINALAGKEVTLSYTIVNQTGAPFGILCGLGADSKTIPVGESRVVTTYTLPESIAAVLIYMTSSATGVVEIGDVKLEFGSRATPYLPNSVQQDLAAMTQLYRTYSVYLRPAVISLNRLSFSFPIDIANGVKTHATPTINRIQITSMSGAVQAGFASTINIIREDQPGAILLTGVLHCDKFAHGLIDAGVFLDYSLDMRA